MTAGDMGVRPRPIMAMTCKTQAAYLKMIND